MRRLRLIAALLLCSVSPGGAEGFSTPFVDVAVLDVPLGVPHAIINKDGESLVFNNLGKEPIRVEAHWRIPRASELRAGALPIPDPSWLRVTPGVVLIAPGEKALCEVSVLVPQNPLYKGKVYQAMLESFGRPLTQGGIRIQGALISTLRFQTQGRIPIGAKRKS